MIDQKPSRLSVHQQHIALWHGQSRHVDILCYCQCRRPCRACLCVCSSPIHDESFINLNDAAKLFDVFDQGGSDFVTHKPRGFVRTEAHKAPNLQCAHALFAGEHQMGDPEPITERLIRVLEDGPGDMGKSIAGLRSALVALPVPGVAFQFRDFCAAAGTSLRNRPIRLVHPVTYVTGI
jgi:hypothetical protein